MNQKELKELIEFLIEKDIAEFELERGDVKVRIKRAAADHASPAEARYVVSQAAPSVYAAPAAPPGAAPATPAVPAAAPPVAEAAEQAGLHVIRSPIVGTFYEAASPGAPPFVKVGDMVEAGQALCIIEAMKLMNEIESDVSGEIVERFVKNAEPVEYGQPLFAIRTRK